LTSLRNMKNLEEKDQYTVSELKDMTRMLSRSDRVKKVLSSPYALMLVTIIPTALQILSMLKLV
jgi:hypothetical protein